MVLTISAAPSIPKRRGSVAARHDKSKCRGTGDCEVVVMGLPSGTPATLVREYINEMMVHYFICPSDSPPIINCWLEGFHNARYAVLVFASAKLATRALDFNGIPFLMEKLDIHRRHEYEGPHPHQSECTASQLLPDKYLPEGKERERWMHKLDDLFNRYVWVEPTDVGLESEEEDNRKLSCPSSTKYYGTEAGRETTAWKAEKPLVVDENRELQRKQHHTEQPIHIRKEGVKLLAGKENKQGENQEYISDDDEILEEVAAIAEDLAECIPPEQRLKTGRDCIDFVVGIVQEELDGIYSGPAPDHPISLGFPSPNDIDNEDVLLLHRIIGEEKNKQENRNRKSIDCQSPNYDNEGLNATINEKGDGGLCKNSGSIQSDIIGNKLLGDGVTVVTEGSTDNELEGPPPMVYRRKVSSGSSNNLLNECSSVVSAVSLDGELEGPSLKSTTHGTRFTPLLPPSTTWQFPNTGDDAIQPLPCPHTEKNDSLYDKMLEVNGGWSTPSSRGLDWDNSIPVLEDCVTVVTAISTEDDIEGPPTVYSSRVLSGSSNMLLEDSSVVSAVSKDGKLGDLSPLRINNDSHHPLPCPPTENDGCYATTLNQKIPSCSDIIPDPYHTTVRDESSAINTTNMGSLVGVKESGRLPWPRNSHTVRRRVARKPQGIIHVRVLQQLGVKLGVMNNSYKSGRENCKRETTHWSIIVDDMLTTKVNIARTVGALADERLDEIVHHFRKKGI